MDHDYRPQNPYTGYYGTRPQKHHGGCTVPMFFLAMFSLCILGMFYVRWDKDRTAAREEVNTPVPADETAVSAEPETADSYLTLAPEPYAELSLQDVYKKVIPSVVSVLGDDATGTGVILSEDGYIITNHHLVEEVPLTVVLHDSTEYQAALVGSDAVSDLAVLKIDASGLTAAEFGDSDAVLVGDTVVAIGDPLGPALRGTMTDGIISAVNQDVTASGRTMTLFQTNARLSGGPLLNIHGQVIAVSAPKLGDYEGGIVVAVPTATAKPIVDALIEKGYVAGHPAIGIQGGTVPNHVQRYYDLPAGVYVSEVVEDADAAELLPGDIITALNGVAVASTEELGALKDRFTAGEQVTLTVWRDGAVLEITVTLVDRNDID